MLIVFTRAIVIYIFLLIVMRLMGKKQLGELQPFEFAITLIAAELACIPMSDTQVPILYGLVPIFTLFVVEFCLTKIVKHSLKMRKLINGKPVIVITPNGIDFEAINKLDMTVHDIMESIRAKDYTSPEEIEWAIIETNGDMSVVPKVANRPLTVSDMQINAQQTQLPYSVICEGKRMGQNIKKCNLDESKVETLLSKLQYKQADILLMLVTGGDDFYLQPKQGKFVTGKISEEVG
ncbi:MAG: DUF421 domain-containing protein [Clostridia bacterium]|nr:DUF421 domain-containing protein [Clostridia bacterium]